MRLIGIVGIVAATVTVACGDRGSSTAPVSASILPASIGSCGTSTALFTTLPVAASDIGGWVPLGAMNPSGHTFPTDHQYIYPKAFGSASMAPVSVMAPGAVHIVGARRTLYAQGTVGEDYSLMFSGCRETYAEFGHVRSIAPAILSRLPAFDQSCNTYSPNPGATVTACWTKPTDIQVSAGEIIGTTAGLDLWFFDKRIAALVFANPTRWGGIEAGFDHFHVVPMSDYFTEPLRLSVQAMLGSHDGSVKRTIAPLGGTIGTDVPGTAQGTWFFGSEPTYPESPHLAIAPDNVDPSYINVSMGLSGGAFSSGLYRMLPSATGPFNRSPSLITPGAAVHCWDLTPVYGGGPAVGVALLQLVDATTLKIEGRIGPQFTCTTQQPLALSTAAVTFKR
jgi:hypothetical protein